MARNDGYWGDKQIWDQVNYRYINNAAARTAALLAGDVDVIDKVSVSDRPSCKGAQRLGLSLRRPARHAAATQLQPRVQPVHHRQRRQAAGQEPAAGRARAPGPEPAINRKAIADRILQGAATEANQWMPKGTFGYNPDIKDIPNDVAQAKKLLAEAGFPDGFKLTMHVPTTATRKARKRPRRWRSSGPAWV